MSFDWLFLSSVPLYAWFFFIYFFLKFIGDFFIEDLRVGVFLKVDFDLKEKNEN